MRGRTDATGSPTANQAFSEQRATTVASYLASGVSTSTPQLGRARVHVPVVLEKNLDGSDNPTGHLENRRVELVLRLP